MLYSGKCPHCGTVVRGGHGTPMKRIDTPIRTCFECGKQYIDGNMYEWSVIDVFYKLNYYFLANNRGWPILFLSLLSFVEPICLIILALWILGCIAYVKLSTEEAIEESKKRTSDPKYLGLLILVGYELIDNQVVSNYWKKYGDPAAVCGNSGNDSANKRTDAKQTSPGTFLRNDNSKQTTLAPNCSEQSIASSANKIIWANAIDFIKTGWNNADIPDLVYFWTALYYSAYDILLQHNLTEIVLKIFLVELSNITANSSTDTDDEPVGTISHFQRKILANLESSVIEPRSQSGMTEILEFAYYVCREDYEPIENTAIDAITMSEYALATANVTMELSCLLNTKEGPATQEEEGEREQALKYVKKWDRVPSVDDLIGKAQNQPGGDRTPGKDIAKGDNGPELT